MNRLPPSEGVKIGPAGREGREGERRVGSGLLDYACTRKRTIVDPEEGRMYGGYEEEEEEEMEKEEKEEPRCQRCAGSLDEVVALLCVLFVDRIWGQYPVTP